MIIIKGEADFMFKIHKNPGTFSNGKFGDGGEPRRRKLLNGSLILVAFFLLFSFAAPAVLPAAIGGG